MVDAGYASFATTVDKTNHILALIEGAYDWPKDRRSQSYAALRSVLHTLRDRLTVDQSAQFAAQLPMVGSRHVLRGMGAESRTAEDERRRLPPTGPGPASPTTSWAASTSGQDRPAFVAPTRQRGRWGEHHGHHAA